jgi:hypothetical protein
MKKLCATRGWNVDKDGFGATTEKYPHRREFSPQVLQRHKLAQHAAAKGLSSLSRNFPAFIYYY